MRGMKLELGVACLARFMGVTLKLFGDSSTGSAVWRETEIMFPVADVKTFGRTFMPMLRLDFRSDWVAIIFLLATILFDDDEDEEGINFD